MMKGLGQIEKYFKKCEKLKISTILVPIWTGFDDHGRYTCCNYKQYDGDLATEFKGAINFQRKGALVSFKADYRLASLFSIYGNKK